MPPRPRRVDRWIAANVRRRRPAQNGSSSRFGCTARSQNFSAYLFRPRLHSHLANRYQDASAWRLRYVTAREAYNIVKAAEAGMGGNPNTLCGLRNRSVPERALRRKPGYQDQ